MKKPFHLLCAGIVRQTDQYSCITDACIILKDALRKSDLINDLLKTSEVKNMVYPGKNKSYYQVKLVEFPKFLYKTVQNKQLLDKLTTEDLQTILKQPTDIKSETAKKTLKTHLDKYNRIISVEKNTFIRNNGYSETITLKKIGK